MHLGIIMDGNRRWAKERGLPNFQGHAAGLETLKTIVKHCLKVKIGILTVYAFSTENWQRSVKEIGFLMNLAQEAINRDFQEFVNQNNIRIRIIGERKRVGEELAASIAKIEKATENNQGMILNIAFSYGGRAEIVSAVKEIVRKGIPAEKITEETIAENLQAPDLDFLIRTGKEKRTSNFLVWQAAYAELFFSDKFWPDFTSEDLDEALKVFAQRHRRRGK